MNSKKVVFFISSLGGGGAEGVCVKLANFMCDNGLSLELLLLNKNSKERINELDDKINVECLNSSHARTSIVKLFVYLIKHRPSLILVFNHQLAVLLILLKKTFRFKFVIVARNINYLSKKSFYQKSIWHKYIVNLILKALYSKADFYIAQSKAMGDDLEKNYGIDPTRLYVINNPVEIKQIESPPVYKSAILASNPDYLLCVGKLEKQKAFHYAIYAFGELVKDHPNLRLKIAGSGAKLDALRKLCIDLGVFEKVDFLGFVSNLDDLYRNARATLLTSLYEGFPNVLIESISFGTPIVAFDCLSGPSEIVNSNNGVLVPMYDVDALKNAVKFVLIKEWDCESITKTANKFSIKEIGPKYAHVFNQATKVNSY
jgi:glycosyltransferase involved in cell wall biosynthesis